MLLEATPCLREAQMDLASATAKDSTPDEHCGSERGRLAIPALGSHMPLVESEKVIGKEHRQEGRLGREEGLGAKPVGVEVVFNLLDALLDGGSRVVIPPNAQGILPPVGHPNPKRLSRHINEFSAYSSLLLAHSFAHNDKAAVFIPSCKPSMKAAHGVVSTIDLLPVGDGMQTPFDLVG